MKANRRLANDLAGIKRGYDVVVVGSGYGGSICAARLAEQGLKVCLLERGKEWIPGEFPDELDEVIANVRSPDNKLGLFDYLPGDDIDVLVGNGLGGTSLINANVVIEPDDDLFDRPRWPRSVRDDLTHLKACGERFARTVGANDTIPDGGWPRKVEAMTASGKKMTMEAQPVRIAVNRQVHPGAEKLNEFGVSQPPCEGCGDCVTGCNVGAKSTMAMNYLPLAKRHGAEIYTCVEVKFVLPAGSGGHMVFYESLGDDGIDGVRRVFAPIVVLGAGSLGSTGILLRSRERGLPLSWRLGHHFSGNGDQLGIGYNNDVQCNSLGFGQNPCPSERGPVGPTILHKLRFEDSDKRGFLIEDGAVPRAFVDVMRGLGGPLGLLEGLDTDDGATDKVAELARAARDWAGIDPGGAANHSMVYLGMGHDGADGLITLDAGDGVKVRWEGVADKQLFADISKGMKQCVTALGGTYIKNPRWSHMLGRNLITVHPLGGCPMGDRASDGVVNGYGEVWNPEGGVHKGLFVADGAVLPDSVGVNPLYTISMLAERTAEHIARRVASDELPRLGEIPMVPPPVPKPPVGLEFTEVMSGFVVPVDTPVSEPADYERLLVERAGERVKLSFELTMLIDDLDSFLLDPDHEADAEGFVDSRGENLKIRRRIERGRFNLFAPGGEVGLRKMLYSLPYTRADGRKFRLDGFKDVRDDRGLDLWTDNTTLFTSVIEIGKTGERVVSQGVLRIGLPGFLKLLASIQVRHSAGAPASARALGRFGRLFIGTVWDTYISPKLRARG